jgi:hypothetical protein
LKIKEQKETKNKVLIGLGTFAGILMTLGILFKIMFWPGANMMALTSLLILLFVFLPVYFFTGFRNPETKVNTVVSSILILTGCGLFLTLVRSPAGSKLMGIQMTKDYLLNEKILENEKRLLMQSAAANSLPLQTQPEVKNLNQLCEDIKQKIVYFEVGTNTIGEDFESKDIWLGDGRVDKYMNKDQGMQQKITALRDYVKNYNANYVANAGGKLMPLHSNVIDMYQLRSTEALNGIIQLQMCILQNERALIMGN